MKPEEFAVAKRPSKKALPGEGAWMTAGASPPKLSPEFAAEARRLSHKRKKPSKEQIDGLAGRFEEEVREQQEKEARRRSSGLARRGIHEELPTELQRPDLHPELLGAVGAEKDATERKASKESRQSERKGSKDSRSPNRKGSKYSDSGSSFAFSENIASTRERRNIQEVLSKNPQLKADIDRLKFNRLSQKPSINPARAKDRAILDDLFLCYDPKGDGTGSLSYREFSHLVSDLGLALSKAEVEGMMIQLDTSGNGLIEMDEFAFFFTHAGIRDDMKANAGDMRGSKNTFVWKLFDEYKDPMGRGLDVKGLDLALKACHLDQGDNIVTQEEMNLYFQRLDLDETGFLSLEQVQYVFDNIQARDQLKEGFKNMGKRDSDMLKQVFDTFDSSGKDEMNKFDLLAAVRFMGHNITQSSVDILLAKIDSDNNGSIDVDEFIVFFEQMRNTEELVEELDKFKKAQTREKYIRGMGFFVALTLFCGGIYVTQTESDPDSVVVSYGYGAICFGGAILSVMLLPKFIHKIYGCFVHECIATFNPTKATLINLILVISIAAVYFLQHFGATDENAGLLGLSLQILAGMLLLVCVAEAAWLGCAYAGFFTPVDEVDPILSAEKRQVEAMERGTPSSKGPADLESRPRRSESKRGARLSPPGSAAGSAAGSAGGSPAKKPGSKGSESDLTVSTRASRSDIELV